MTDESELALARADALLAAGRHDEAIRILGDAAARSPDNADVQRILALALLRAGRKFDAQSTIARAIQLDPERPEPYLVSAEISMSIGSWVRAEQAAHTACKLAPLDFRTHFLCVQTALKLDRVDVAWAEANQVCELAPWAATGHHARGLVHIRRREWNWAEREYRAALAKVPNDPIYLNNLGVALMNQGSDDEAMEYFTRAGRLDVRSDKYRKNTAAAAHRHVGGLLAPHWVRTVLLRHRYRGLSPAARTALEIDGANIDRETREVRTRRWKAWLTLVIIAGVVIVAGVTSDDSSDPARDAREGLCTIIASQPGKTPAEIERDQRDLGCPDGPTLPPSQLSVP